ncbi:MAG: hypothetical protein M1816_005827 [Peltula sp. TS41687]|nr:MAG: hypothetical protein M1816_005827 [Peltula sp. TS41687]
MRFLLLSLLVFFGYTTQASPPLRRSLRSASAVKETLAPGHPSEFDNLNISVATYTYPTGIDSIIFNVPPNNTAAAELPATQIRGRFYFPFKHQPGTHPIPLVILFPGRHGSCREQIDVPGLGRIPSNIGAFDDEGGCAGNQSAVESHRGFDYLGYALASYGYATISIEPLIINGLDPTEDDPALNKARARLLFRTIDKALEWNRDPRKSIETLGFDIAGRIDFSNIGLMGHSRGGAAVRLAYNLLESSFAKLTGEVYNWKERLGVTIKGVVEIAPYEAPENGVSVNVTGVPWALIGAGCEDDLIEFAYINLIQRQSTQNLEPNHFINVYGANHNYFNSEWPLSLETCLGDQTPTWDISAPRFPYALGDITVQVPFVTESPSQRAVAQWVMTTFMRSYVGRQANRQLAKAFDPARPLPKDFANGTEIGRANLNLARSKILQSMESLVPISVSPPARAIETVSEHTQSAFKIFRQQYNTSTLPLILQPGALTTLAVPLKLARSMNYDAIAIHLSSADSEIRIPLSPSNYTNAPRYATANCAINIDVARRDNCLLSSRILNRNTCSKTRILIAQVIAGDSYSPKVPLKSRFNLEFVPSSLAEASLNSSRPDVSFLPIAWETISLPCPRQRRSLEEVRINISSDDYGLPTSSNDIPSSVLYLGPVRVFNEL